MWCVSLAGRSLKSDTDEELCAQICPEVGSVWGVWIGNPSEEASTVGASARNRSQDSCTEWEQRQGLIKFIVLLFQEEKSRCRRLCVGVCVHECECKCVCAHMCVCVRACVNVSVSVCVETAVTD